ncbi:MAG: hypothetical protein M3071_17450 [Actinomycetota bacterium]|nr:hypothetical protein [Actinomycetota bacterium]
MSAKSGFFYPSIFDGHCVGQANYRRGGNAVRAAIFWSGDGAAGPISSRRPLPDNPGIAPESTASGWKHLASRAIDWLEPDHNPAGVVYGTLIIGAVLATESVRRETLLETVGGTVVALVLYWLAHSYAQTLGDRLERQVPLSASGLVRSLVRDRAIIRGASIPIIALLVASALGASLATAVLVAVWTSSTTILVFEVVAGVRAQLTGRELIVQICAGAVMGLAIIGLRTVLH